MRLLAKLWRLFRRRDLTPEDLAARQEAKHLLDRAEDARVGGSNSR